MSSILVFSFEPAREGDGVMKRFRFSLVIFCALTLASGLLPGSGAPVAQAQPGPSLSFSYDFLPFVGFDEPVDTGSGAFVDNAELQLRKLRASFSLPIVFSEGRTVLVNELAYQR